MSQRQPEVRLERVSFVDVANVPFAVLTLERAVDAIIAAALTSEGYRGPIRFINAYCVAYAVSDEKYRLLLSGGGINMPDGLPVSKYMRRFAPDVRAQISQVRGPSVFTETISRGRHAERPLRHFFFGSTRDTLDLLTESVKSRYPGAEIAGTHSPPFGEIDDRMIQDGAERILRTDADIVWVGMGSPKQDWVSQLLCTETGRICIGVGAAFDFTAGTVSEAPDYLRRIGLEWLFRLAMEPRRLWKRYLIGNVKFLYAAEKSGWRGRARRKRSSTAT